MGKWLCAQCEGCLLCRVGWGLVGLMRIPAWSHHANIQLTLDLQFCLTNCNRFSLLRKWVSLKLVCRKMVMLVFMPGRLVFVLQCADEGCVGQQVATVGGS
jgi:hypothetical protein